MIDAPACEETVILGMQLADAEADIDTRNAMSSSPPPFCTKCGKVWAGRVWSAVSSSRDTCSERGRRQKETDLSDLSHTG